MIRSLRSLRAHVAIRAAAALTLAGALAGCGARSSLLDQGSSASEGAKGGPCHTNGTCDPGLVCTDGICGGGGGDGDGDTGMVAAPSCAPGGPGLTDCGDGSESCCTSLLVHGGKYFRTYKNKGNGATKEADPATISTFRLDKYEVTVGRFRQFLAAAKAGWVPAAGSGKHAHLNGGLGLADGAGGASTGYEPGWDATDDDVVDPLNTANYACDPIDAKFATWTDAPGNQEKLPINCLSSDEAYAFCIWDGGFLPSEAEWEYAAAGGSEQREYIWGTAAPGTANQYAVVDCQYPAGKGASCSGVGNIAPVGSAKLGVGAFGQLDLGGNMAEWTLDYGHNLVYVDPCEDCGVFTPDPEDIGTPYLYRMVRGSSFDDSSSPPIYLLPPGRNYASATGHNDDIGLRCARAP